MYKLTLHFMKSMINLTKYSASTIAAYAGSMYIAAGTALAQGDLGGIGEVPTVGGGSTDIRAALVSVISYILGFLGLLAVIVIVVAGIRLVTVGSDEAQRTKARDAILYAVIGLVIILLASAIVNFAINALT
jgi:type IV secretory pathway VirB2 component (pilin)